MPTPATIISCFSMSLGSFNGSPLKVIPVGQFDTNRVIEIELYDDHGIVDLSSYIEAALYAKLPDEKGVKFISATIDKNKNTLSATLTSDMLKHIGKVECTFYISGTSIYGFSTPKFYIEVLESESANPDSIEGQSSASLLTQLLTARNEAQTAAKNVTDKLQELEDEFDESSSSREQRFLEEQSNREERYTSAESQRDAQYKNQEVIRTEAYEAQEKIRDGWYEGAENRRDALYDVREDKRDEWYDDAEKERQSDYNTNEATRQSNETSRQTAENSRVTAENARQTQFTESKNACDDATQTAVDATSVYNTKLDEINTKIQNATTATEAAEKAAERAEGISNQIEATLQNGMIYYIGESGAKIVISQLYFEPVGGN